MPCGRAARRSPKDVRARGSWHSQQAGERCVLWCVTRWCLGGLRPGLIPEPPPGHNRRSVNPGPASTETIRFAPAAQQLPVQVLPCTDFLPIPRSPSFGTYSARAWHAGRSRATSWTRRGLPDGFDQHIPRMRVASPGEAAMPGASCADFRDAWAPRSRRIRAGTITRAPASRQKRAADPLSAARTGAGPLP